MPEVVDGRNSPTSPKRFSMPVRPWLTGTPPGRGFRQLRFFLGDSVKPARNILLVEDDPNDIDLTFHALAAYDLDKAVDAVRDGAEALDYVHRRGNFADRRPGHPVVVLLDLKMPRISGLQVLRELKADPQTRTIPVVALTSSRADRDVAECYRLGVSAYVVKPVGFAEFTDAVKILGSFWAVINEPPPPRSEDR